MKKTVLGLTLILCVALSSCGQSVQHLQQTVPETVSKNAEKSPDNAALQETENNIPPKDDTPINNTASVPVPAASTPGENTGTLSAKEKDWFFQPKTDGTPSGEPADVLNLINKYPVYYLGDASKKIIYLTFDEGYENGFSGKILDVLKEKNVKAAFFVTTPYIKANKDLVKRMVDEGHLVCNHSTHHPSMAAEALKGKTDFDEEFSVCEKAFEDVTSSKMPKFFRPPMGKYSELSLKYTQDLGYKTIFWSFAYNDWDVNKQPDAAYAKNFIMSRTHPGGIYLLHAVSKTNTEILPWLIDEWKAKGYEFKTLNELPAK